MRTITVQQARCNGKCRGRRLKSASPNDIQGAPKVLNQKFRLFEASLFSIHATNLLMFGSSYSMDPDQIRAQPSQMTEITSRKHTFMTWDQVIRQPHKVVESDYLTCIYHHGNLGGKCMSFTPKVPI